jgi:hypothetical protein
MPCRGRYLIRFSRFESDLYSCGFEMKGTIKSAGLYIWMGDGSARDYTTFEGKTVYLYDVNSKQNKVVGQVSAWKASGSDVG